MSIIEIAILMEESAFKSGYFEKNRNYWYDLINSMNGDNI
tara:strand:- start:120 stop:239 length:120 start_codon:yes stop_codon:yes gene_type:complete